VLFLKNRIQIIIILILAVAIGVLHYQMKNGPPKEEIRSTAGLIKHTSFWIGKLSPNFEIPLLDGDNFVLADHIGQEVIVLNFFATWSTPSQKEMPELNKYYEKNKDNKFIMIGIDADEKEEDVASFIDEWRVSFPIAIDRERALIRKFNIVNYPTTVVIGVDGRIALYETGAISNGNVTFDKLLQTQQALLAKKGNIDKAAFLAQNKSSLDEIATISSKYDVIALSDQAKALATKLHCPVHEYRTLLDCNCYYATQYKKRLTKIKFDHKTDDQLLQELFLYSKKTTIGK
jgi:peroxiredoxin